MAEVPGRPEAHVLRRFGLWPPGSSISWIPPMSCAIYAILLGIGLSVCAVTALGSIVFGSTTNSESALRGPMPDLKVSRSSTTIE